MWNEEDRKWLYEQMKNAGVNTGSYDEFKTSLSNKEDRDWYYQKSRSMGLNVGSANDFASMMVEPQQKPVSQPKTNVKPTGQQPVSKPVAQPNQQKPQTVQPTVQTQPTPLQPNNNIPTAAEMLAKHRWTPQPMLETEEYLNEEGQKAQRPKRMPGMDSQGHIAPEGVYRDVATGETYDATAPNTKQVVKDASDRLSAPTTLDVKVANRQQVSALSKEIDAALEEAQRNASETAMRDITNNPEAAMRMSVNEYPNIETLGAAIGKDTRAANNEVASLQAAKRSLRDAQRIIDEADRNIAEGKQDWLGELGSFIGGASRGFGQKLFDVDNWDMGITDTKDSAVMMNALIAADNGKPLTKAQQAMLDAKAVELATNAYFGSYIGRGYKAGQVTAESIPFMIEMCLNPAAGVGSSAQAMMTRYALKRFGKAATKKAVEKMTAKKIAKELGKKEAAKVIGARVAGDIAGSAAMTASTGTVGVIGDAISRANGDVLFNTDENGHSAFAGHANGEDFGTAFSKAFAARTIENYSEMVGDYFAPVLNPIKDVIGKGLGKAATSKIGTKLSLDKVKDFTENVATSDLAKLVKDFEQHSKWNGTIGEFAEEIAGGAMNAAIVGDQTLDTDPNTGVFNKDNLIDTFLGVSLMGGAISGLKTIGYRTPKYRARKEMERDDNKAATAFGNQDTWGEVRNALAFGTDEDAKYKLAEVLSNPDFTEEQKQAAMQYAKSVQTYRGMLQTENKKRTDEDADPLQNDAETSFDNGYSLESDQELQDAKNMYDFQRQRVTDLVSEDFLANIDNDPMGTLNGIVANENWSAEERQTILDYVNAKATFDGMITRVQDDIESKIQASDAMIDGRVNQSDGMIHPATMKVDDRKVYVVNGNINMNEDGTGIDLSNSDESILIRDAETGNMEFADPRSVLSLDEAMDAAKVKQEAQDAIRLSVAQEAANRIEGTLAFNAGDAYNVVDENGQEHVVTVLPQPEADTSGTGAANGNAAAVNPDVVTVSVDGGEAVAMNKADVQQMADNANMKRLTDYETEKKAKEEAKAAAEREAQRPVYQQNDEITIQTERGPVRGSITLDDVNGEGYEVSTEVPVDGKVVHRMTREQLDAAIVEHNGMPVSLAQNDVQSAGVVENGTSEAAAVQADGQAAQGNAQAGTTVNADATTEQAAQTDATATVETMPMIGEGEDAEPDFSKVDAARAHTYLYNEAGLSREEANQFVEANKKAADKKLETLKGKKPQMGTSIAKYRKESAAWQQKVDEAKKTADYWNEVKNNQAKIVAAENAERAKRDEDVRQQAVAAEQQRQQEVLQKREEQAQLGSNNVAPQIKEKWQNANKVEGARNEIILPNGERVAGKYVLVESGAATPSHNPNAEFVKNEGFPVDENGQSVNDRDYERDEDAKTLTRNIAGQYDSRALQTPVVVSNEGIVLSGNGRTMAGELAAQNGTDGAYIDYLKQYGSQFGFDAQTVSGMQHPRVLFVPDEAMPYTAETFAKFNQQDMKGQSKTEQAVKLGKIVGNDAFSGIVGSINKYNTLAEFYADTAAATEAINALQKAGAISQAQYAEMFDGDTISAQGRELLENMLIGKAFESNPDAVRQITAFKSVRQTIISALAEIANNIKLGKGYSLESELAQAIALVYHARNNGYKAGDRVSSFARQLNLFPFDEGETVADYNNSQVLMLADVLNDNRTTLLKKCLQIYNSTAHDSAMGQLDMFTGRVQTKNEIVEQVKQLFSNGTKEEQQKATEDAIEKRKADSIQENGTAIERSTGEQQAESEVAAEDTQDNPAIPFEAAVNNADNVNNETPALSLKMKQEIMLQYLADVDGDMRLLDNMTEEDIDEFLAVLDKWEEVNDKLGEVQQQYGELAKSKNKDVAENAQNIIKQAEQASVEAYMPVQDLYHDMLEKYGIEDDMELANAPVQGTDEAIAQAEAMTEQNPTEGQKEAGNYKKGHVKIDGFDISIENPKGSERKGTDAQGNPWSVTMNNTYGYIRRTEGVDGDHIDVFLSDNLADWNGTVFVVDQVNTDGTFDEHKVMYGFNTAEEAKAAYMANYSEGWQGFGNITGVSKEEFKKWIDSSHRKIKPFAEYKNVKSADESAGIQKKGAFGTIYTQFKGKAKEAIAWLMQKKEGEASGALHHHSIGDISLVWGDNKTGLAKIANKHPEVLDDLQNIIDAMEIVKESDNRIKLESNTHFAVVSKEYMGEPREKWLLTAYEKKETPEPANSRMDVDSNLNGKSDDTATRQNSDVSNGKRQANKNGGELIISSPKDKVGSLSTPLDDLSSAGKGTQNSDNKQEKAEKSAKNNGYSITSLPYTNIKGKKLDTLLVKFDELSKEQKRLASDLAKKLKGWWSFDNGGFMMRDAESAQQLVDAVMDETQETLKDNERMSLSDMQVASGVDEQAKKEAPISRTDTPTADMFIGRMYHSKKDPSRITLVTEQIQKGVDAGLLSMLVLKNGEIVERQRYPVNIFANIIKKGNLYPVTDRLDEKTAKWVEEWKADKEAQKDVKLELADEADGSREAKPRGTVAEKTETKKEERDPRYREGWDGDYDEWKKRRDYYDEIERKEKKAVEEGREAYYVAGVDGWGQRDGTFHKLWLLPTEVKKDQWGNLVFNGTDLWTEKSAWHSEEGFQLGKIYYTGDEFTKAKNVAKSKKFVEEPTVENHDWEQYKEGDLFEYEGNKCRYQFYDNGIMSGVPGVVVEWLDENGNAVGKESVPPLMFIERYKKVESPAAKQQGTVAEEIEKAKAGTGETGKAGKADNDEAQKTGEAYGANNALVSRDRYEELKKRMRMKLGGQMNMGIDPEILAIGTEMAAFHIEAGARKFADFAVKMIEDLGDAIRPYLKSFYNGARELPEVEAAGYSVDMTPYEDVRAFDVANFDKAVPDAMATAEEVVKEQETAKQAEEAINKLTEERNEVRKAMEESEEPVGRPATEADFENGSPVVYYKGKRTRVAYVVHKGSQVGAAQFEKPHIDSVYLPTGENVKVSDLMIIDKQEGMTEKEAVQEILKIADKGKKERKSKKKSVSLQPQLDLFGENDDNVKPLNNNDNGLQGNDGIRTEGLSANGNNRAEQTGGMGKATGQEGKRTDRGGEASGSRGLRSDVLDSVRLDEQLTQGQQTAAGQGQPAANTAGTGAAKKNTNNNHAERGKDYAPKSVDARIQANIKAIELMKQLVENGEKATSEQMAVLRQYSGWGGLGKAFERGRIDYKGKSTDLVLQELLGPEGYKEANMSRNSAYFTPAPIIDTLWDIARAMGFKGGNVLEGSAGIGNIIGLMPTDLSERSDIHAVEIDSTTGNMLALLYPDAKVDVQGFEKTDIENGSVDLAITNVPFVTGLRVNDTTGDKDLSKKFHDIHDFCIAKNVRKLREGGIGIFITSSGTMDNSTKLREWITNEGGADFVGAFRLHNQTFGGTGATSDILVIRKRVNGRVSANAINVSGILGERVAEYNTGETKKVKGEVTPVIKKMSMDYNQYFVEHPEQMAGDMQFGFENGDTFRPMSKALYPNPRKMQDDLLSKWAQSFAGKEWDAAEQRTDGEGQASAVYEHLGKDVKEGSLLIDSKGNLCTAKKGMAIPLMAAQADKSKAQRTEQERIAMFQNKKIKGHTKAECFKAYTDIKKALNDVLSYQSNNDDDAGLQPLLDKLNKAYDKFVATYGHFHKNNQLSFLKNDVDFSSVFALEKFKETADANGKKVQQFGKTDVFSRRVVQQEKNPEPKNMKDGIIASIYIHGRIDVPYISEQLGKSEQEVRDEILMTGLGFENPSSRQIEVSYEYLSGNVREKLQQAIDNNKDGRYNDNIKALEKVVPISIPSHLIDFSIGSSWIDPKLYEDYVKEKTDVSVKFTSAGGTWYMQTPRYVAEQKNRAMGVSSEMLNMTIMGTQLIEAAMQNRTITVSTTKRHYDGTTETITDKEATQACGNKIDEIRQDFKDWARERIQGDNEMAQRIERTYNDMFNNYVPKSIPQDFIPSHFGGQVTEMGGKPFSLRPHQAQAVIRATTQPLMLAHEVGTGKTFTLISIAMEMRRLGTARKPMIVVQNATLGQFVESAKELYPNAKVLSLSESDRTKEGRKDFYAKIKYNDWDIIVVPQSVFEMIPDSEERQMQFVQDKIDEKMMILEQMRDADPNSNSMIVRQAEKEIDNLKSELATLTQSMTEKRSKRDEKKEAVTRQNTEVKALEMLDRRVDDVENFDDMGIDAILVDEAHEYKHLGFATAMKRGVKGVDPSYSKKSQGVFLKAQAVLEKNHGRNVVFATGTPISNTAAEIWTFMRYLMPADTMKDYGIYYFDDFVRNFGSITQMLEFTASGSFKEVNRFAGYMNLPELVRIWSGVTDTVLTREAGGVKDKIPEIETGKAQDIYLPQTRALRSVMKYVKSELKKFEGMTGKEKKENSHIPLVMFGIAKAAAVDARLVVEDAADEQNSKTNESVRQVLRSLEDSKAYNGTVALFADNYQNKRTGFNLYYDIRRKLIDAGVPAEQIVVIESGMTVKKKLEIFDKVNSGEIRVIMGSTYTLGTGVNIQERLHTLIHIDAPNRPMDYTQRNGRILRQGNLHKDMNIPVRVLRFGVEDSLDVTAYQRLKTKGAIADSIMNGKAMMANSMENRTLEEEEDVFGDTVAQLSGSEYAMLKNQAEKDVRKYTSKKKQWENDQRYCHNEIPMLRSQIRIAKMAVENAQENLAKVKAMPAGKTITIGKQSFRGMEEMTDFIKEYNKKIKEAENELRDNPTTETQVRKLTVNVGGIDFEFTTNMEVETIREQATLFSAVHRKMTYSCKEFGLENVQVKGALLRTGLEDILENVVTGADFKYDEERYKANIEKAERSLAQVEERYGKPFEYEKELKQSEERLFEYTNLMKKELEEKEAKYAEMDEEVEEAKNVTESSEAEEEEDTEDNNVRFRDGEDEDEQSVNDKFNNELDLYEKKELPQGHRFELGYPSEYLLSAGFENLPISMRSSLLSRKAGDLKHPFKASELKDLVNKLQKPIAIFNYSKDNMRNLIVDAQSNGKHFLVGITLNFNANGIEINSVSGLFPKESHEWIKWIQDGKAIRIDDKEKVQDLINSLRTNPAESERIGLNLNSAAKIVNNFENPSILQGKSEELNNNSENTEIVDDVESTLYRQVEDEDTEEWLDDQPTIKVYRSMALIDGKLYPPMSSKAVGSKELRNPSELGKWEEAEEAPDKAKKKGDGWYFTLNKDNGKQVRDVAYNPYIHTSRTMLNDQFSEAQSRDNLVVVEMEVPISELYSGYKAEKAKDSVGVKQWKAGIIQGMLSGTREVILTRWAKPVRIVPVEEVADNIVDMLDGKVGVMPSNVVTPQQRKALEDRGIKFIETDNKGKIKDGVNAGKTWASVYGSKANGKKAKKSSTKERQGDKRGMTYEQSLAASKSAGYSKAQHDSFVEREKRRIRQHAENIVAKLGIQGRVTIMETQEGLEGNYLNKKGWFNTKTGKIVVVLGNHHSASDVVRTVLHEGVAHYGLRALFGENFNQFLDNVFQHAEPLVRQKIVDLSKKHNWDFRTATEEYLAQLAEDTEFENAHNKGWFSRIKSMFLSMLRKIGLADYAGPSLTDNELRYLLWRSYENLAEPGRYRNPFREAKDISKQMDLKVGNYDRERARIHSLGKIDSSRRVRENAIASEDRGALFRDGDFSERDRAIARDAYERAVSSGIYQFKEAVQDSMLGLKELYKAITGNKKLRIEEVEGYENAYLFENRLSSSNQAQQREYYNEFMRPLLKAIGEIAGTSNGARQALTDYMMAKHGLERNDVMPRREAEREAMEEFAEELKAAEKAVLADPLDMDAIDALEGVKIRIHDREEELYFEKRSRDYSGLTALTGKSKLSEAEAEARRMVADYEAAYDTQDLWELTREATQATLEKVYKSGLLSRDRYEDIRDMFEYYIPLQGWDETTSDEVYGYLTSKDGLLTGSPIKKAKGRSSKADDPIATIAMMADAAIMQGNRNLMKQSFLNFVLNNPSDLVSVNELWLQHDDTTDEWVPVFADLSKDDTPADVERKVQAFEERMEQLREKAPDKYKRGREAQSIPYKVVKNNLREHQVLVKRNGRTYVLTINGNPRAAQALNGLTNPDVENTGIVGNMLKAGEYINRHLSSFYTTRNPDFVVSNFLRDLLYSNCMSWVKEPRAYAVTFHKNFLKYNPIRLGYMLKKWDDGTLDMNNSSEKSFYQFMINGGETGYTSIRDIEQHKKEIIKELKREGSTMRKVWNVIAMQLDRINRSVENCARFAAFVTSQEFGRSIERSVYDAKEVSVNFNKKGSGGKMVNAKGQKLIGKIGSYISGSGRLAFVFWNAGVQGLTNFGRNAKQHKGKAFLGASAMFSLGCIIPLLAGGDGDGDDENAYYNLPEYIRRTNICIRLGKQWITIPLPIEYRSLYGLGELATGVLRDKERYSDEEMAMQLASQISQILPLDMLEGGGGVSPFIPSLAKPYVEAYIMNRGWTGLPVYKQTPWNENDPEWSKAYKNTDKNLVAASKWLNEATGGDDFKKGAVDINPAKLEYLLGGMFGGYITTSEKMVKMAETASGSRDFDWRNILLANRVVKTGDERTANRKLKTEYFNYKDKAEETHRLVKKYENAAREGAIGMAEKADFMYNSDEYLRYRIFDAYSKGIERYNEAMKSETNDAERKKLESEMYDLMRELIDELHETENKK